MIDHEITNTHARHWFVKRHGECDAAGIRRIVTGSRNRTDIGRTIVDNDDHIIVACTASIRDRRVHSGTEEVGDHASFGESRERAVNRVSVVVVDDDKRIAVERLEVVVLAQIQRHV